MIRPLDLQTLYMNLDKVGKEQAQSKEALIQTQAAHVQKMQKEHDQGQHAVGKTNPVPGAEGENAVKVDVDARSDQGDRRHPKAKAKAAEPTEEEKKESGWTDPELGKHVDLSR